MPWEEQSKRLLDTIIASLAVPPTMTVSQWAEKYRVLSSEASATRGRWKNRPFQSEVMDVMSAGSGYSFVVLMMASQMFKTECAVLNFLGYTMMMNPGPTLVVEPGEREAEALSKDRVAPMVRDTPQLRAIVSEVKSRDSDNTIFHKKFPGGHVTFVGAHAPSGLAMRPICNVLLDEIDRWPLSAGSEGDPVSLVIRRTDEFKHIRKIVMASSPTTEEESKILPWFLASDQRKPYVPCPRCQEFQILEFERLEWPENEPQKAQYRCDHCQELIPHSKKHWMLDRGEWRITNPKSNIAGFWISKLYSVRTDWGDLAEEFLRAKKQGDLALRSFWNTALARPWKEKYTAKLDEHALLKRTEPFGLEVPDGIGLLTAGVDVQGNRLQVEIVGWGKDEESWSVRYLTIPGDPARKEVWQELDTALNETYDSESGVPLRVSAACVDYGAFSASVESYAKDKYNRRVWAIIGRDGQKPIWPHKAGRSKHGCPLFTVGVDTAKELVYSRLRRTIEEGAPGPGYCHFPIDRDYAYFEELTVEKQYTKYRNGFPVKYWQKPDGARNEALDCRVYALAALHGLYALGRNLNREVEKIARLGDVNRERRSYGGAIPPVVLSAARVSIRDVTRPIVPDDPYL